MQSFTDLNNSLLESIDPELSKAARAARVRDAFANAVLDACDTPETARYMLGHVQAVYVMRDDAPQKAQSDRPTILLRIYSDDSTVRAELDARQEWIRMSLARQGITYDRMRLHASSFGMRQREPFSMHLQDAATSSQSEQDVTRHALEIRDIDKLATQVEDKHIARSLRHALEATSARHADEEAPLSGSSLSQQERRIMVERLETLKRAFCVVFGGRADAVLEKVNAAYLVALPQANIEDRNVRQCTRCILYASDENFKKVMDAYGDQVRDAAFRLGLRIRGRIRVVRSPRGIVRERAFPRMGNPIIVNLHQGQ